MTDFPRLIEYAFPLKQASLDSVHEKNVRHGHISTLHIWPARRPLAACRAALIATLLPDPGDPEKRRELCEKIGGQLKKIVERKKMPNGSVVEREKWVTEGGVLHWHGEPKTKDERAIVQKQKEDLEWFRQEIRKAYGGRAPRVLDPFAGGGAIPLEAMRLGCEATAADINPVAWFILKCTLEYPQKLAGQIRPLPDFILSNEDFMLAFFEKAKGRSKGEAKAAYRRLQERLGHRPLQRRDAEAEQGHLFTDHEVDIEADLAWHVRAWGQWVLEHARCDLAKYYPVYAEFQPLKPGKAYEAQPMRLVPFREDRTPDIESLNAEFSAEYLGHKLNPRWVAKPTVAYLWARTVTCKNCRATLPLLKTRWLAKKDRKRVLLAMTPNADGLGVEFSIEKNAAIRGGNAAQRREHDRNIGAGTLSGSGAACPCCRTIMTMEDIQVEAQASRWGCLHICTVVDGPDGKEYRLPTREEESGFLSVADWVLRNEIPGGRLTERIDPARPSPNARGMSGLTRYGLDTFGKLYNERQLFVLARLTQHTTELFRDSDSEACDAWCAAIRDEIALAIDRLADRNSTLCHWDKGHEKIAGTFQRYALRVNWDFCEVNPFAETTGNYRSAVEWIAGVIAYVSRSVGASPPSHIHHGSATNPEGCIGERYDLILTDPPYYDAIPYADISDFFYVWLRRAIGRDYPTVFHGALTPKDEELIQHAGRMGGDNQKAKDFYEEGMALAFVASRDRLDEGGRLVIVFANKQPDAWESLAASLIRAGFAVDASWPIETEMPNKAAGGARLASSVWLVCRKRVASATAGWDTKVLTDMRANIGARLRDFWDAGIRGPDFVWAATGPALEAYSKHPAVKKTTDPGKLMTVSEFLAHVRRIVVDYVVGQVLSGGRGGEADAAAAERLDEPTAYYLLHRYEFGLEDAPIGAVILYAVSCGLSDRDLTNTWDLIVKSGGDSAPDEDEDAEADEDEEIADEGSGSRARLKVWSHRKGKTMGYEAPSGRPVPLIDRIHRLMHLWRAGDVQKVDQFLDDHGLRRQELFKRVVQSLIELARHDKRPDREELQILESLSNHIGAKGATPEQRQAALGFAVDPSTGSG